MERLAERWPATNQQGVDNAVNRNILYLLLGAAAVGCIVLGVMFYQERQKSGVNISIGGRDGVRIEGK
jgi:hypothetical protein